MIRVMIVDDNAVVREGIAAVLGTAAGIEVVARAADGAEAERRAIETRPDVTLLDVQMPNVDGIVAAAALRDRTRILMLTYSDDSETVRAALRAGAQGFLVHGQFTPEELTAAVERIHAGDAVLGSAAAAVALGAVRDGAHAPDIARWAGLTRREEEIVELLAGGLSNAEIAGRLFVSVKTVKNHLHHAYAKLGVTSRAEAVAVWLRGPEALRPPDEA